MRRQIASLKSSLEEHAKEVADREERIRQLKMKSAALECRNWENGAGAASLRLDDADQMIAELRATVSQLQTQNETLNANIQRVESDNQTLQASEEAMREHSIASIGKLEHELCEI